MLPKDGVRPQLIPEHKMECLSSPQAELLYEYMKEDQAIDPVKLGLCEYQVMEPVDPCYEAREDDDSVIKVYPYEALVINDASKIGATESPFDPRPQKDVITPDQTPCHTLESHTKGDKILMGPGGEVNLQDMDQYGPIHSNCHTWGQFVGGGMLDILLDTGASKSYMSKGFYMRHPHLHKYPKFNSMVKNLQVGNGELVATLFVIPFVFTVGEHMFEVYTLVSEIQQNMDIILGIKNMFEIEGEISCRTSQFRFLNRSLPIFTLSPHRIKVGAKAYVKAKVPFVEKLSGHAIAKLLYKGSLGTMKIRLVDNLTVIQIINNTPSTVYLSPEESIGIVDLRSLGYYNIKPQVMHFHLTGAHNLFSRWNLDLRLEEHFAKISTQNVRYRKGGVVRKSYDPYPWLDEDDPRRQMTDEEILY